MESEHVWKDHYLSYEPQELPEVGIPGYKELRGAM